MKKYIKPNIEIAAMRVHCNFLAGSGDGKPNQALSDGSGTHIGGYSQGSDASGDNGNVEDMAKDYNAWTTWDED